jgi:hypothetical protein
MGLGARLFGTVALIAGGALVITAVIAAPALLRAARPMARETLRRGLRLYDRARTASAEFVEDVEDLVAEVQSELSHETVHSPPPAKHANEA